MAAAHIQRVGTITVLALLFVLLAVVAAPAWAYPPPVGGETGEEPFSLYSCAQCHATDSVGTTSDGSGPHDHITTTTQKCNVCHSVHAAPAGGVVLTRGATVSQSCLSCHDGTGATVGVYTTIAAHDPLGSAAVLAEHTVDFTNAIPGGSGTLAGNLGCSSCHSPHGANTVQPFLRDSGFSGSENFTGGSGLPVISDCLLRSDVNTSTVGAFPEYSAKWCASCHDERHSASTVNNHPVDGNLTWGYGDVESSLYATSLYYLWPLPATATGVGRTNGAYVMAPVDAPIGDGRVEVRRDPMCQQCHEDARNVMEPFHGDYTHRGPLPAEPGYNPYEPSPVNPEFLTFPHQTTNPYMLVETADDLCLNCHDVTTLP